jgi:hypothetical protein
MPPTDRFVISFAAEPPQDTLPYGRRDELLREHFVEACSKIDAPDDDLGQAEQIRWFPDRTYCGRTFVPATARTTTGFELYGYVSYVQGEEGADPAEFLSFADYTGDVAENNPDWKLDLNEETIDYWRGENGNTAEMTLIWGTPMLPGGTIVTAELADLAVDQCALVDERFTMIAADNYREDYLEIKLWGARGNRLASESLYVEDAGDDDSDTDES